MILFYIVIGITFLIINIIAVLIASATLREKDEPHVILCKFFSYLFGFLSFVAVIGWMIGINSFILLFIFTAITILLRIAVRRFNGN